MNREHRRSPFDLDLIPSSEEIKNWDPRRDGPSCTEEHFQPDLRSTPGTTWNKSAISVFVNSFLECDEPYENDDPGLISKTFRTHLNHLAHKYQRSISGKDNEDTYRHAANRDERKRAVSSALPVHLSRANIQPQLFRRRLIAAMTYDGLKQHVQMLRRLGMDGMSSDESSVENDIVHYRVVKKRWRNEKVTSWLRAFDAMYRKKRVSATNRRSRGAAVHAREVTNNFDDSRAAVPHLPRSAYDETWLHTLQAVDLEDLCVREEPYLFEHLPEIRQYVLFIIPKHV